ncbi:hypothetical protein Tsubulata_006144 [Turnera subulata]|uniref:Dehydrin n=1 Tax=Turnera subulata TaxID=218843 RepID=A0A9Q0FA49_9ROSI|nr:hypothetical protein Tsubulata_006144 [Turnera subulata]
MNWDNSSQIPSNGGKLNAFSQFFGTSTSKPVNGLIYLLVVINCLSSFQIYAMPAFDNLELRTEIMADHYHPQSGSEIATKPEGETTNRGFFDCFKSKDEEKPPQDVTMEDKKEEDKPNLKKHLHRSDSNSSSSSDEEEGEGVEKKKKKGLKDKIKEKISGEKEGAENKGTAPAPENFDGMAKAEATDSEEKKGFLEKIKEKLPGHHKKAEEGISADFPAEGHHSDGETKEKKGFLEKIKEKIPGGHKNEEEKKAE